MTALKDYPVIYEQQVAWGDMDAFGHVNNVIYYRYIESARLCYLDKLNIFEQDIYTVVASNQCKYIQPVLYPDRLKIGARVDEIRNSAFRMHYSIWSEKLGNIVATGEAVIVCVNKNDMKKVQIPTYIKDKIKQLENEINHLIE
ncbi:thioesterase family protein [Acinetobacter faecalis]|uniref:acyl-CoA thioesterase n=1 Tax=Acinetobacter faecalis TaxID=2665161 RepID=UPI002A90BA33|nr:thioesterase family protein [Acinetobacter faecalis]MDY6468497.1 thioesterase family protein [Acinetobacter faecalis]